MNIATFTTTTGDSIKLNKDQVVFSQGLPIDSDLPSYYHCLLTSGTYLDLTTDPLA